MKKAALLIIACAMFSGCASRKKEVHEAKSTYKFTSEVDSSFSFTSKLQGELEKSQQLQVDSINWRIEYDGQLGDSLCITETGPDGKTTKTTFHGKGKANMSKGHTSSSSLAREKTTSEEETHFEASTDQQLSVAAETKTKDKKVQQTGFQWLWVVLVIVIIIGRWLWSRRKGVL
jgi:cobalamin biosynthesis Mg chelatase CobN